MKKLSPAVRSMLSMAAYLVIIIFAWLVIGNLAFPSKPLNERVAEHVAQYEGVLTQIAENAIDPEQWTGIRQSESVEKIFKDCQIYAVFADEDGAAFALKGRGVTDDGYDYLLYRPDGQFIFRHEGADWVEKKTTDGTRYWVTPNSNGYVHVWQLSERFYLEEAVLPGQA